MTLQFLDYLYNVKRFLDYLFKVYHFYFQQEGGVQCCLCLAVPTEAQVCGLEADDNEKPEGCDVNIKDRLNKDNVYLSFSGGTERSSTALQISATPSSDTATSTLGTPQDSSSLH